MKRFVNSRDFISGWYIDPALCDSLVAQGEQDTTVFQPCNRPYNWIDLGLFNDELSEQYCQELFKVLELYKQEYNWSYEELRRWGFTRPRVQRYEPGNYYDHPHCENDGSPGVEFRHLVYMTYLNDIHDGGGTEFIHQNLITPAEKGLTLIWPAAWTHYHQGVVAPKDTKYIITGWCVFETPQR